MGGSSSTQRSITIEEEAGSGVVKVSEDVAKRLVGRPVKTDTINIDDESGKSSQSGASAEQTQSEIEKIQTRYEKRIRALEKQNLELHQTTVDEFAKAVQEVEAKFLKTTASPICDDLQTMVMKCYHDNPSKSLNCSQTVRAYSACVQKSRESILKSDVNAAIAR